MMTLDVVRGAVLSADPYDRMDGLVRAELAAGRSVDSLIAELNPLVDDALDTPGLTRDGREAFLGTLDRLTGDCVPEQHYHDLPVAFSLTFPDPAAERRGLGLLAARFAGRVRSNGAHVLPREAVIALLDERVPFTVVGPAPG